MNELQNLILDLEMMREYIQDQLEQVQNDPIENESLLSQIRVSMHQYALMAGKLNRLTQGDNYNA